MAGDRQGEARTSAFRIVGALALAVVLLAAAALVARALSRRRPAARPLPDSPAPPDAVPRGPGVGPAPDGTGEDDIACVPPELPPLFEPRGGTKSADPQQLWAFLQQETYRQRGEGFRSDWAFHRYAALNALGAPLSHSARSSEQVVVGGRRYGFQPFARDTLFNEIPNWSDVRRLSEGIDGQIPASGLYAELLAASFRSSGGTLRPTQAFAQFVVRERLGPALSEGFVITVEGADYAMQLFALDTLYSPVGRWSEVGRLSATPPGPLRERLWQETYRVIGAPYDPASPLHQLGVEAGLGTPLSGAYSSELAGQQYDLQVFALDTLYALPGEAPARQSALPLPEPFGALRISGVVSGTPGGPSDGAVVFAVLPLAGQPRISQFYGYTRYAAGAGRGFYGATQGRHSGIDFAVPVGTPLLAMDFGLVVWSGANTNGVSFGAGPRSIIVRYGSVYALYGHVSSESVSKGQRVSPGQELGRSGYPSAPHLHFELRPVPERMRGVTDPAQNPVNPGFAVNPLDYFSPDLRGYFESQLAQLGGSAHFCCGALADQDRVTFGGPVDTRPCA